MSRLTREINRALGRAVGVQVVAGRTRAVRLNEEWFQRFLYFNELVDRIAEVPGAIVECGVAEGTSLAMLASLVRASNDSDSRHVWGFDSWEGLPAPTGADAAGDESIARTGMFSYTSVDRVREELAAYGWDEERTRQKISLVPGWFDDTLPSFEREIALLHIDVDLYESYQTCLRYLWPWVRPGGIVAFDEYEDAESWPGARRAVDEFLGSIPQGKASLREDQRSRKWWVQKAPEG
jgi:hypothetical protein